MTATELEQLGRLYRQATSDLAIARRDFPGERVTRYLEQLAGRAHPVVYRREARGWAETRQFLTQGFPRAFREAGGYTAVAFALFFLPFMAAVIATNADPLLGRIILPPGRLVDQIEQGRSWLDIQASYRGLMAASIMTNNIQVAILAFGGGIFFGLGTVYVLVNNGLMIGATAAMASAYGLGEPLGSFVAAHSGIELTVIFIAGGAGLRLGHALLAPGLLSRRAALSRAAGRAVRLLGGCIPLLVVAGTLEGFVSPSELPAQVKLIIGATATIVLYCYLLFAGRNKTS